jgi:hypothetical protein
MFWYNSRVFDGSVEMQANVLAYVGMLAIGGSCMALNDLGVQMIHSLSVPHYCAKEGDVEVTLPVCVDGSVNVKINVTSADNSVVNTESNSVSKVVSSYGSKSVSPIQQFAMNKYANASVSKFKLILDRDQTLVRNSPAEMEAQGLSDVQIFKLKGPPAGNETVQILKGMRTGHNLTYFTGLVETGQSSSAVNFLFSKNLQLRQEGETAPMDTRVAAWNAYSTLAQLNPFLSSIKATSFSQTLSNLPHAANLSAEEGSVVPITFHTDEMALNGVPGDVSVVRTKDDLFIVDSMTEGKYLSTTYFVAIQKRLAGNANANSSCDMVNYRFVFDDLPAFVHVTSQQMCKYGELSSDSTVDDVIKFAFGGVKAQYPRNIFVDTATHDVTSVDVATWGSKVRNLGEQVSWVNNQMRFRDALLNNDEALHYLKTGSNDIGSYHSSNSVRFNNIVFIKPQHTHLITFGPSLQCLVGVKLSQFFKGYIPK